MPVLNPTYPFSYLRHRPERSLIYQIIETSLGAVRFCRENVYIRDNFTCQYCGDQFPNKLLTLDHVVPVSKQGPKNWTNVVTACRDCNQRKANRTPTTANMPLLTEPMIPTWLPSPELDVKNGQVPSVWIQYLQYKAG